MEENLGNKHVSHLTPLRVNSGKQDNNYFGGVFNTVNEMCVCSYEYAARARRVWMAY